MPSPRDLLTRRLGGRAVPWLTYYRVAREIVTRARGGWEALTPAQRRDLARIVRDFRGRPGAVPAADRARVRELVLAALRGAARPRRRQK